MQTHGRSVVAHRALLLLIIGMALHGCAGPRVAVSSEGVVANITGNWSGTFTNRSANEQVSGALASALQLDGCR